MGNRLSRPRCKEMRRGKIDTELTSGVTPLEKKCNKDRGPGQHGDRRRTSDYGEQLQAKQNVRNFYRMGEKQFRNYFKRAAAKSGSTGDNLLHLLESRLDNVVYRMGFACTRAEARQLISHRSITVNDQIVSIPSYRLSPGDVVEVREKAKGQARIQAALELAKQRVESAWLEIDETAKKGEFKSLPDVDDLPPWLNVQLVVELYSK